MDSRATKQSTQPEEFGQVGLLTYGTVRAIDPAHRLIALGLPDGRTAIIRVSDSVSNFDQVRPGEDVVVRYTEPAVIAITKSGTSRQEDASPQQNGEEQGSEPRASTERQQQSQAPEQQQPRASQQSSDSSKATISGEVAGIDSSTGVLVVQSDDGDELVMRAPDSGALADLDKGDRVLVTYIEAAIVGIQSVEDSEEWMRAQRRSGTSSDMDGADEQDHAGSGARTTEPR